MSVHCEQPIPQTDKSNTQPLTAELDDDLHWRWSRTPEVIRDHIKTSPPDLRERAKKVSKLGAQNRKQSAEAGGRSRRQEQETGAGGR